MQEWDSEDEEEELGMAARTLLTSIPRHRLKALESMEADAKETNAAVKVAFSAVHRKRKGISFSTWLELFRGYCAHCKVALIEQCGGGKASDFCCTAWCARVIGECSAAYWCGAQTAQALAHHGRCSGRLADTVWERRHHTAYDGEGS